LVRDKSIKREREGEREAERKSEMDMGEFAQSCSFNNAKPPSGGAMSWRSSAMAEGEEP
jgi:hypothetical protein